MAARILALLTVLAVPRSAGAKEKYERGCVAVARVYLLQLRENLEGCDYKIRNLRFEMKKCRIKPGLVGTTEEELKSLENSCEATTSIQPPN